MWEQFYKIPQSSVIEISLKLTYLKFCSNLPGAIELMPQDFIADKVNGG